MWQALISDLEFAAMMKGARLDAVGVLREAIMDFTNGRIVECPSDCNLPECWLNFYDNEYDDDVYTSHTLIITPMSDEMWRAHAVTSRIRFAPEKTASSKRFKSMPETHYFKRSEALSALRILITVLRKEGKMVEVPEFHVPLQVGSACIDLIDDPNIFDH